MRRELFIQRIPPCYFDLKALDKTLQSYETTLHLPALGITVKGTNTLLNHISEDLSSEEQQPGLHPVKEKRKIFRADAKFIFIVDKIDLINDSSRNNYQNQEEATEYYFEEIQTSSK